MTCGNTPALVAVAFLLGIAYHGTVWFTIGAFRDREPPWRESS